MALISITGYPCSGKTTRAQELLALFSSNVELRDNNVATLLVSDHQFGYSPEKTPDEKTVRASLLGFVERSLTKNTIVIVDSSNELKSMRYQLSCLAKTMSSPHLVIQVGTNERECSNWNAQRKAAGVPSYSDATFSQLVARYEFPNPSSRWDSPLWIINPQDELPVAELVHHVINSRKGAPKKLHAPTQPKPKESSPQYLQAIDAAINEGILKLEQLSKTSRDERIHPSVLQRKKKEFLHQLRLNPIPLSDPSDNAKITAAFLDYVYL